MPGDQPRHGQSAVRRPGATASRRAFFTTSDSVEDIESLRQALGYQKLVLFGVSYD